MSDSAATTAPPLPEGLVAFVKRDCPTCELVAPVLADLESRVGVTVYTQDDPSFPEAVSARVDDTTLAASWHHEIETVPTLLRVDASGEQDRIVGWSRDQWEAFTELDGLGSDLPEQRPGCGSMSVDPNLVDELRVRFTGDRLRSRRIAIAELEDEHEALFSRGWSDGLPLVPPTEARVLAMLDGTDRSPDEVVATVAPDLVDCTVEKAAVNAVMAGCRPEYFPVVLAGVEAVCNDTFNMHGMLATTMGVGPILIVNGPIRHEIGMNSGINVFGQGNRANLTIGRAVQLIVRNVGGGRPGEVDRATFGNPGKLSFCFAENEEDSPWDPLSTDFGHPAGVNTVTAFPGEGPRNVIDQLARTPEELARTLAVALLANHHPKLVMGMDTLLAVSPDHARVFAEAGWTKAQLVDRLLELTTRPADEILRGVDGIAEGVPREFAGTELPKYRPDGGIRIVHCGGGAGLFSAVIAGWVNGEMGAQQVSVRI